MPDTLSKDHLIFRDQWARVEQAHKNLLWTSGAKLYMHNPWLDEDLPTDLPIVLLINRQNRVSFSPVGNPSMQCPSALPWEQHVEYAAKHGLALMKLPPSPCEPQPFEF